MLKMEVLGIRAHQWETTAPCNGQELFTTETILRNGVEPLVNQGGSVSGPQPRRCPVFKIGRSITSCGAGVKKTL